MELLDITFRFNVWTLINIATAVGIGVLIWVVIDDTIQNWKERKGYK